MKEIISQADKNNQPFYKAMQEIMAEQEKSESVQETISNLQYYLIKMQLIAYKLQKKGVYHRLAPGLATVDIEIDELIREHGGGL